jgi:peptidoglycan/xylan/chitin deacetylase (PgdA/CDA1 family)
MSPVRALRRLLPPRLRRRTLVSLTFDDGTADHLFAARLLAERGLTGTFYVNTDRVGGSSNCLDWTGVEELASAGHEVGGHTSCHVDLSSASPDEAREEIAGDRRALVERGYEARSFAYPYGALSPAARELAAAAGYSSARRSWGLAGDGATESVPLLDPYAIRTVPSLERGVTPDELRRLVVRGEREGGWLPLVFHGVSGSGDRYDVGEAVFREFLDWLCGQPVRVLTVGDAVEGR